MTTAHKNTCVSETLAANPGQDASLSPATRPDVGLPGSDNLVQEYAELQQRFQRTTNALASAAHDLKTPLAILNGYIELLQNEKLGSLNERQREILGDMSARGQRLQSFFQDFLSYRALE